MKQLKKREIIWSNLAGTTLEHLCLSRRDDEIAADGIVLGAAEGAAFRIRYKIVCNARWRVRKVAVGSLGDDAPAINLLSDGAGNWTDEFGNAISEFKDCLDADISVTPFTNTLPVRRLTLKPGESAEIKAAYISVPEMRVSVERQRYARLESNDSESRYEFKSLDGNFTAILTVDAHGLVKDYPGLFKRVWANEE